MLDSESRAATLARYAAGPARLKEALDGLGDEQLDLSRRDGAWTIREIVHHLADGDDLVKLMVKAALGKPGCTYDQVWYDTDNAWAQTLGYADRDITPAVALFEANRAHVLQLFEHFPDAWESKLLLKWEQRPDGQEMVLGDLVRGQSLHAIHHCDQIIETRRRHGA